MTLDTLATPAPPPEPLLPLPITVAVVEDEAEVRGLFETAVRSNPQLSLVFSADTAAGAIQRATARPQVRK